MAKFTPLISSNAFTGPQTLPGNIHINTCSSNQVHTNTLTHSFHIPPKFQGSSSYPRNSHTIPVRLVVGGAQSAPFVPVNSVVNEPTQQRSSKKVEIVVTPSSNNASSSHLVLNLPAQQLSSAPQTSPGGDRFKLLFPENPPPYENIFNVSAEEGAEPFECPSLLAPGGPRKEKKRSLRSRLLRHLTGKKAAEREARKSKMTPESHGAKNQENSQRRSVQLTLQQIPGFSEGHVHLVHNGTPVQMHQNIPNHGRFFSVHLDDVIRIPTSIHQESYGICRANLMGMYNNIKETSNQQITLLNSVPEEENEKPSCSTSNNASHTVKIDMSNSFIKVNNDITSNASQFPAASSNQPLIFIQTQSTSNQQSPTVQLSSSTHKASSNWSQNKVPETRPVNSSLFSSKESQVINDKFHNGNSHNRCSVSSTMQDKISEAPAHESSKHASRKEKKCIKSKEVVAESQIQIGENAQSRSFTINLKPGMYKLNLNLQNKIRGSEAQTINITVPSASVPTPSETLFTGQPPTHPEPLYYRNSSKVSLPQRFVHMLKPSSMGSSKTHSSKNAPKVTIIQQSPNSNGTNVITVHSRGENAQRGIRQDNTSSSAHKRVSADGCRTSSHRKERYRLAERKKTEGNEAYRNKEYREALVHYTQAIDLCPDCPAYYSNRSACYMMLGKYREALNDAQSAVTYDKTFVKGWLRVGKCHVALGDANAAISVLRQAVELEPGNAALLQEVSSAESLLKCTQDTERAVERKDYRTAVFHLDQALRYALGSLQLRINKAEYLTYLGRVADAEDIVNEILLADNNHADALYVRGLCRYYQDNQEAAFQHFQCVLRLVPDHPKAKDTFKRAKLLIQKKEAGNTAFKMGELARAMELYSEALEIDERNKSTNSKLYCNRATVAAKLGKLEQAISDCTAAVTLDDSYVKAYLRRANTYQQTEQYEEAVRDLEKVYKLQRSQEHKRLLQDAKAQLKRAKRKDYYKILGVSKTATDDEVKKAYRKMALLHHPDRHSNASASEKAEHERKFKDLGEAYAVLTDPKKRSMHDRGQDVNDPECGFSRDATFEPNQVFEAFFGPEFFASQSHHFYDQGQGQPQPQQFQGQFQGPHAGFQGFSGMPGGFQFGF